MCILLKTNQFFGHLVFGSKEKLNFRLLSSLVKEFYGKIFRVDFKLHLMGFHFWHFCQYAKICLEFLPMPLAGNKNLNLKCKMKNWFVQGILGPNFHANHDLYDFTRMKWICRV